MTNATRRFNLALGLTLAGVAIAWGFDLAASTMSGPASHFALFLGRFHPLLVHLPIGMLILLGVLELATVLTRGRVDASAILPAALPIAFASAVGSFVLGTLLSRDEGYPEELLTLHRGFTLAAVVAMGAMQLAWLFIERGAPRLIYRGVLVAAVGLLSIGAHFGGTMTHGEKFLTEYAPGFGKDRSANASRDDGDAQASQGAPASLDEVSEAPPVPHDDPSTTDASAAEVDASANADAVIDSGDASVDGGRSVRPVVATVAAAPAPPVDSRLLYADLVAPVLSKRCVRCHGPSKHRGGLRVDSIAALLAGGDTGPGFVAFAPKRSELVRRLHLPRGDDEHMPPSETPQLSAREVALIEAWIAHGGTPEVRASVLTTKPAK